MLYILNKGGPVMYPLLVCSIVSLAIIFERAFFWIKIISARKDDVLTKIMQLLHLKKINEAIDAGKSIEDKVVKVLVKGLGHGDESFREAAEMEILKEEKTLTKGLPVLNTIITVSPLLGILGTVYGIIGSFQILGSVAIGTPKEITGGIAQALLTTGFGLSVAIFTLIPYSYFQVKADNLVHEMEENSTKVELLLKKLK